MPELEDLLAEMGGAEITGPAPLVRPPLIPGEQRLSEPTEDDAVLTDILREMAAPPPRGAIRRALAGAGEAMLGTPGKIAEGVGIAVGSEGLTELGQSIQPTPDGILPYVQPGEEGVAANLGRAGGSGLALAPLAALGPVAGAVGVGAAATAQAIPDAFYSAKAAGEDDDEAYRAALATAIPQGLIEGVLGPERMISKIAGAMAKADKVTGGAGRALLISGLGEGTEEAAQSLWGDLVAQTLYDEAPDEDWKTILGRAAESAAYGAAGGLMLGSVALAAQRAAMRRGGAEGEPGAQPEPAQPVYSPLERDATPEEEQALERWKADRKATRAEFVERPEAEEAVALARKTGATVLFVDDDAAGDAAIEGMEVGRNLIILPAKADPATALLATATHESVHTLPEGPRAKLVDDLTAVFPKEAKALAERYKARAADAGKKVGGETLKEESAADLAKALAPVVRRVMTDRATAVRVMGQRPGLMIRVLDTVRSAFGATKIADRMQKELDTLAEVRDEIAAGIDPRKRIAAAIRIVKAYDGIKAEMSVPIRIRQKQEAAKQAQNAERGLMVVPQADQPAKPSKATMKGDKTAGLNAQVADENTPYRPGAVQLGDSKKVADELRKMEIPELQAKLKEAEESQAYEEMVALREAQFSPGEQKAYKAARSAARSAQRSLDMARTEREVADARENVLFASKRLAKYESRLTTQQRERLRSTPDPEVYERAIEAKKSGLEVKYGDLPEGSAREQELLDEEQRGLERAVPSVRYSLATPEQESAWAADQAEMGYSAEEIDNAIKEARSLGIDVTKSDNLYSLEAYIEGAESERYSLQDRKYPKAGDSVDGRTVRGGTVPNTDSIAASLNDYEVLAGVREVQMSDFKLTGTSYSVEGDKRIKRLADEIKESGEITPLIVVEDADGPYILEGATRADALQILGAKSFPALVVIDKENPPAAPRYSLAQTVTPEFKRWFGASKVVDGEGKPLVVYHSGLFDENEDGVPIVGEQGMHFGSKAAAMDRDAGKPVDDFISGATYDQDENGRWHWSSEGVESFDFSEEGFASRESARKNLENFARESDSGDREPMPMTEAYLSLQNVKRVKDQKDDWSTAIKQAKAEGYDGLVYRNEFEGRGSDSYVAFAPTQVKSTGNLGTFSPESADIRYSLAQTSTPEFKRWFGDSKVVDGEGKPLVMYHGTNSDDDFTVFAPGRRGLTWFTSDPKAAAQHANAPWNSGGKRVMPVYLRIRTPSASESTSASNLAADGMDGFLYQTSDGHWVAGVISPNQIKSATGNSGAFDPENPDIRYSLGNYAGSHRPPGPSSGAPLHDLTGGGSVYPDDVYSANGERFYGQADPALDRATFAVVRRMKGKPEAEVSIYRSVPSSVDSPEISSGDWVTVNKEYAKRHGESWLNGEYKIISKVVKAKEVFTNGDSIHEYGYWKDGRDDRPRYSIRSDIEKEVQKVAQGLGREGYQLANAGTTLPERGLRAAVRSMMAPEYVPDTETEARVQRILNDPQARTDVLAAGISGEPLNVEQTVALDRMARAQAVGAWAAGSEEDMAMAQATEVARQQLRTEQARTMGTGLLRDAVQTPMERAMRLLLTPSRKVQRKLAKAETWQARRAILREEAKKVMEVRYALAERGFDPRLITDDYFKDPEFRSTWARAVADAKGGSPADWYISWRRASMLSAPITAIRNLSGNTAYTAYDRVLRLAADSIVPGSKTETGDVAEYVKVLLATFPEAWSNARDAYRDFYVKGTEGTSLDDKANLQGGKIRTAVESVGIRVNVGTDAFFKTILGAAEIRLRSRQMARAKGGVAEDYEHDPDVLKLAKADMERALFLDRDKLTRAIVLARDWADETFAGIPVGSTIVPFASTPTQLVRRSGEALLGPAAALWRKEEKGGTALLGLATWAAMIWAASLFDDDDGMPILTGSSDWGGEGEFQGRTAPAYSIRIGDSYYSYKQIQPLSMALASIVDGTRKGTPMESIGSFVKAAKDQSFFQSIETIWDAVQGVAQGERGLNRAGKVARELLWTPMIPNVIRSPVRSTDEVRRKEIGDPFEQRDFAYAALPIAALGPPLKHDLWGRPVQKEGGTWVARVFGAMPMTQAVEHVERVDALLGKFYSTQEKPSYFDAPETYVTRNKQRIDWTEEEYSTLTREAGTRALERIRPWVAEKDTLTKGEVEYIGKVISATRAQVANELLQARNPE